MDSPRTTPLVNRAGEAKSAYELGQKDSPVAWQLLDDESIARAAAEDKLIFLHIGYSACHYSHLMTTETFANSTIATALNRNFVPVILDRDARPDLDTIYMNYLEAVHGVGGWPLNVFLTPELEPVFGGTFWPAPNHERHGKSDTVGDEGADFLDILHMMQKLWMEQRSRLRDEARGNVGELEAYASEGTSGARDLVGPEGAAGLVAAGLKDLSIKGEEKVKVEHPVKTRGAATDDLDIDLFDSAVTHILGTYDPAFAGFTQAPKYVTAPKLSLLLRLPNFPDVVSDMVGERESKSALQMALATLRTIDRSALHDHLGRGFSRASVTADWSLPFFERVTVENVLLLELFVDAWLTNGGTKEAEFYGTAVETAEYLSSAPLVLSCGLLGSAEKADSHASVRDEQSGPGAYYLWTRREFRAVLEGPGGDMLSAKVAAAYWNVLDDGNVKATDDPNDEFVNRNILRVVTDVPTLAREFKLSEDKIREILKEAREKLAASREAVRKAPEVVGNAVAGTNGLAVGALARFAGALEYVDSSLSKKFLSAAEKIAGKIKELLWDEKSQTLLRLLCTDLPSSTPSLPAFTEDYAYVISGLISLYNVTNNTAHLTFAKTLQSRQNALFLDPISPGGFFTASDSHKHLLLRLKSGMDGVLPAGNGVSVANLLGLAEITGDKEFEEVGRRTVEAFEAELLDFPWLFAGLLGGVVAYRLGVETVSLSDKAAVEKKKTDAARWHCGFQVNIKY